MTDEGIRVQYILHATSLPPPSLSDGYNYHFGRAERRPVGTIPDSLAQSEDGVMKNLCGEEKELLTLKRWLGSAFSCTCTCTCHVVTF